MNDKNLGFKKKLDLKKKTLRTLFLHIEKDSKKGELGPDQKEIAEKGMVYTQMSLPVHKITKEFEDSVKNKIEHNIYNAKISEATEKDLNIVKDIYNKAWLTSNTPFRPIEKDTLKKIFEDPDTVFLIAKVFGIDAGFIILDFEGKDKEYGIIVGLGILPRYQHKGLGTILGLAAWNFFKQKGLKELRCEVYQKNQKSYNFIKSLNFEEIGEKVYRKEDFELNE
ncbi:MAG: GNAT family N-acetyltransferase [Candidatus Thorarchaeota archaeon]